MAEITMTNNLDYILGKRKEIRGETNTTNSYVNLTYTSEFSLTNSGTLVTGHRSLHQAIGADLNLKISGGVWNEELTGVKFVRSGFISLVAVNGGESAATFNYVPWVTTVNPCGALNFASKTISYNGFLGLMTTTTFACYGSNCAVNQKTGDFTFSGPAFTSYQSRTEFADFLNSTLTTVNQATSGKISLKTINVESIVGKVRNTDVTTGVTQGNQLFL